MTVYSGVISRSESQSAVNKNNNHNAVATVNAVLSFTAIFAIAAYVILSNFIISQKYSLDIQRKQYNQKSIQQASENNLPGTYKESDLEVLIDFAKTAGMVEASSITAIIKEGRFVLGGL